MNTNHSTTPEELNAIISRLADYLLTHRIDNQFRELAREEARQISIAQLDQLRSLFHDPPPQSDVYDVKQHGLGGWLSACQFAIFELIFNLGEDALPFIREIAWGEYDWTQGNAIELLLRFAAEGIRTDEILAEIKTNFPQIHYEAQLYCMQPLLPELKQNAQLKAIFDQLRNEIEEFEEVYAELTEEVVDEDPYHLTNEVFQGMVIETETVQKTIMEYEIIGSLTIENSDTALFPTVEGRARILISDRCQLFQAEGESVEPVSLAEILSAGKIAVGNWTFSLPEPPPPAIIPGMITRIG
ncbi:MAG: hypothetical protein CME32_06430 [Gimesia sp.]|nr:hypothetical protein [Gimesia sp.]